MIIAALIKDITIPCIKVDIGCDQRAEKIFARSYLSQSKQPGNIRLMDGGIVYFSSRIRDNLNNKSRKN